MTALIEGQIMTTIGDRRLPEHPGRISYSGNCGQGETAPGACAQNAYNVSVTTFREDPQSLGTSDAWTGGAEGPKKALEVASVSDCRISGKWLNLRLACRRPCHLRARLTKGDPGDWESQVVAAHHKAARLENGCISVGH